mmetsp:Transcript_23695/g.28583  ORF Transcript_23695/g.28583 Transcript_23695/m.28583 type:complete len:226 (-) Transcript_23695:651-1328(-)
MLVTKIVTCLNYTIAGPQHKLLLHARHLSPPFGDGSKLRCMVVVHPKHNSHPLCLLRRMSQHSRGPVPRVHPRSKIRVNGLKPQQGLVLPCSPQQPEVSPPRWVVRPCGVGHQKHLVSGIRKQWQQALTLDIKSMTWPSNLSGPKEPELIIFIFMCPQTLGAISRGALHPNCLLSLRQPLHLLLPHRITVPPLLVRPLCHVLGDGTNTIRNGLSWHWGTVECALH